ncbi:DUF1150 family protein [Actibacterium sp. 188UL27-1]|uniref:DUF1150 family protein n=1 Tax=Actibacterium sp. 188UL27-1 TaxID=2786961 RepID=UPI00195D8B17|nr:DUF1150 family protein [Actibacterium sp. 188UL27-1]MBM7068080.1 DUF1150 family protein [Actibacterium sp. 188UL27-1]
MMKNVQMDQVDPKTVYVRPVKISDLPKEVQEQADGHDALYAVHDVDGAPLALVADRELAFILARQNDMTPVSVH